MATPTRSQMASTPKNHLSTTPNRPNASPRTNLGAFAGKGIAGKSPAVKTPASLQGHAHRISLSSHPTSTPHAASTLHEDILNMTTPSALMASMGSTGLTPLPTTQDGLGISTGMSGLPSTQDGLTAKNPEKERYERLKEASDILRKKTAGRGVSRQHIQQLAQIHGFDEVLDEDNLTIAGQRFVDLEICFDRIQRNKINKVSLKLNALDQDEGTYQEAASHVLADNLILDHPSKLPWHDLTDFSDNLAYLSKLEHVHTTGSCFHVIDNLYDTFQRIWTEEKKRMKWRHGIHHLCQSNVGEPQKDKDGKLGLRSVYWTRGQRFFSKEEPTHMADVDKDRERDSNWLATFSVASGLPSIPASQKWLAEDPLTSTARAEDIFQESFVDKPSWQDPAISQQSKPLKTEDTMDIDLPPPLGEMLNLHFTCQLEPEISLPLSVAQTMNGTAQIVNLHQDKLTTFQEMLLGEVADPGSAGNRWIRTNYVFSTNGEPEEKRHSYMLYTTGQAWVHPISKLDFSHPQQYAEALPVLRQYALVNTLLQSIKPDARPRQHPKATNGQNASETHRSLPTRGKIIRRSNKPKLESKLDSILHPSNSLGSDTDFVLPVDVRIDPLSSPIKSCRVEIRVPLSLQTLSRSAMQRLKAKSFLAIQVDILLNGIVEVLSLDGIEMEKERTEEFKKKVARAVRACEDLGTIVAWVLREFESS